MRRKILVSVTNTGYIHKQVAIALLKLQIDSRFTPTFIFPTWNPYELALNKIANDFMDVYKDHTHWLQMDSDNPPMRNPFDLIEYDRDIIGCVTPTWHSTGKEKSGERPVCCNAYSYDKKVDGYREYDPKKGLQEVDAVGTGCVLISKRVFLDPQMRIMPFNRQWALNGEVTRGCDISFCEKAKRQGFSVYANFEYPCFHFCELEINENIQAWSNWAKGKQE